MGASRRSVGSGAPAVKPGEAPLLAFISSVMRPELEWARNETVAALRPVPYLTT
jgi:hypothetical protein